ncbi:MAG: hypothetical protein D3908_04605 [Candidatus Electrothrix sp. AUS4]|nr:hypothetical protein [Candidatus Electrothrix sp. AUS4]
MIGIAELSQDNIWSNLFSKRMLHCNKAARILQNSIPYSPPSSCSSLFRPGRKALIKSTTPKSWAICSGDVAVRQGDDRLLSLIGHMKMGYAVGIVVQVQNNILIKCHKSHSCFRDGLELYEKP